MTYGSFADTLPPPANRNSFMSLDPEQKIIEWLSRLTAKHRHVPAMVTADLLASSPLHGGSLDDWQIVASLCGYGKTVFQAIGADLPLTGAEIDHFRRNHRDVENIIGRDFLVAQCELPSPLSELYGLYRHRARMDAEAALFVAQATGSVRVASGIADLLAVGGFANAMEFITHLGQTYSVPAAFDTSDIIDRANHEALRRLNLAVDHPAHILKLSPDEIAVLAANIADKNTLTPDAFLEKSRLLAEARQDTNRLPLDRQFATAIEQHDLPLDLAWVKRIGIAYANLFEDWVAHIGELKPLLKPSSLALS
jgi:hypothetical protein